MSLRTDILIFFFYNRYFDFWSSLEVSCFLTYSCLVTFFISFGCETQSLLKLINAWAFCSLFDENKNRTVLLVGTMANTKFVENERDGPKPDEVVLNFKGNWKKA